MAKRMPELPPVEPRIFRSADEIDLAISKIDRRIKELEALDVPEEISKHTGAEAVVASNVRETIREVFGQNSPEFREHEHLRLWAGGMHFSMSEAEIIECTETGRVQAVGLLKGLIGRLTEKREDLKAPALAGAVMPFDSLNLHPRVAGVSRDLFLNGHLWEAVFAGAKALVNLVKESSGVYDSDGAPLMRKVFSRHDPILAFNDLSDQTDADEQEGLMHMFEGAVLAVRNPGGHAFPEGTPQRAIEYLSFISLLAYRVQEAKRRSDS